LLGHSYGAFQAGIAEELESPLPARSVAELKWYFEQLRTLPTSAVDRWVRQNGRLKNLASIGSADTGWSTLQAAAHGVQREGAERPIAGWRGRPRG
jgi:hypothetical protein